MNISLNIFFILLFCSANALAGSHAPAMMGHNEPLLEEEVTNVQWCDVSPERGGRPKVPGSIPGSGMQVWVIKMHPMTQEGMCKGYIRDMYVDSSGKPVQYKTCHNFIIERHKVIKSKGPKEKEENRTIVINNIYQATSKKEKKMSHFEKLEFFRRGSASGYNTSGLFFVDPGAQRSNELKKIGISTVGTVLSAGIIRNGMIKAAKARTASTIVNNNGQSQIPLQDNRGTEGPGDLPDGVPGSEPDFRPL